MGLGQWSTLTGQRSIRAGFKLGLDRAGFGPGLAYHVACCGAATSRPWAFTGLRFQAVGVSVAHGGPEVTVHGPKAGSMVDQVHPSLLWLGPCTLGARAGGQRGGVFPYFSRDGAPAGGELTASLVQQRWCPIGEGKNFPGPRRLCLWGQGGGQGSPRCWPRRAAARAPPACGNGAGAMA